MTDTINIVLENISGLIRSNFWLAPVLALAAGLLTSVMPCSLSSVPLVVAYVGGSGRKEPSAAFRFSLVFAFGMAITFTALGAGASFFGMLLNFGTGGRWYIALGGLMILMALQTWGIITIIPSTYAQGKNSRKGYFGALIMGVLGGLFSSPCATPVLIALLALVARSGNPPGVYSCCFCIRSGIALLVIVAGTFMGVAGKLTKSGSYGAFAKILNIALGLAILLAGLYFIYTGV